MITRFIYNNHTHCDTLSSFLFEFNTSLATKWFEFQVTGRLMTVEVFCTASSIQYSLYCLLFATGHWHIQQ